MVFISVSLYSNGVRIGTDEAFCQQWLPFWKDLGLDWVKITVHDVNEVRNAKHYGIPEYPPLRMVFSRIHDAGLRVRANLLLSRETIGTCEDFIKNANHLREIGVDSISAWALRGMDDEVDPALSPSTEELDKMELWGMTASFIVKISRSREGYLTNQKMTLFQNGVLSSKWCN